MLDRFFIAAVTICASLVLAGQEAAWADDAVTAVRVEPESFTLKGPAETVQVLVHGQTASGRVVDLTGQAILTATGPFQLEPGGLVAARGNGAGAIQITFQNLAATIPGKAEGWDGPVTYDFANDVTPILSRYGCNASACHGKAGGQNGFQLSVFGFDPAGDHQALAVLGKGRRLSLTAPDASLLLLKASGGFPHEGGVLLETGSREFRTLRNWVAAGAPLESAGVPRVKSIRVSPSERILSPESRQQLRVIATRDDGREVDVTALSQFEINKPALAEVDERGLIVTTKATGQAAVMARYLGFIESFELLVPGPALVADSSPALPARNYVDEWVDKKWAALNLRPSGLADDAEYLRRVYLDITGTLPTAAEARSFLTDSTSDKRAKLVNSLLERPEYAEYWALRWADQLRVDSDALGKQGAYALYKWLRDSLAANKPFDVLSRELIAAEGPLSETPQGYFYRLSNKPGEVASAVSQAFLGVRITCAECHHHPFDRWEQDDFYGMQAFFQPVAFEKSGTQEFLVANNPTASTNPRTKEKILAHPLGSEKPQADADPAQLTRTALADWMTAPENPWFARNIANRVFAQFFGRGLVEPVDDVRETNPPSNPELMDALAKDFAAGGFDVKQLIRTLTASRTYQLASRPNDTNSRDEENYARALFKRMPAEVLLDAVCQTTGVPEKFDGVPAGARAVQLWDSRVNHFFLELFGRPVRVTSCDCERATEPSMSQVMHLMNSPRMNAKIADDAGTVAALVRTHADNSKLTEELYLTFFSRFPDAAERDNALRFLATPDRDRRALAEDLAWSLLNSLEFVFNH